MSNSAFQIAQDIKRLIERAPAGGRFTNVFCDIVAEGVDSHTAKFDISPTPRELYEITVRELP
jgi:hypothetical protein